MVTWRMPASFLEWLKTTNGDEFTDDNGLVWKFAGTQIVDPEYDGKDKNAVLFKVDVTNNCLKLKDFDFFAVRDSLYIDGLRCGKAICGDQQACGIVKTMRRYGRNGGQNCRFRREPDRALPAWRETLPLPLRTGA